MSSKLITQLLLFIIAVAVIFTYIQPSFAGLSDIQAEIDTYTEAIDNAFEYNSILSSLLNTQNAIPRDDLAALERYLPIAIDEVAVAQEIESMAAANEVEVTALAISEPVAVQRDDAQNPQNAQGNFNDEVMDPGFVDGGEMDMGMNEMGMEGAMSVPSQANFESERLLAQLQSQQFTITVTGDFEALQAFLLQLEANAYPLKPVSLDLTPGSESDGSEVSSTEYSMALVLETYAFNGSN